MGKPPPLDPQTEIIIDTLERHLAEYKKFKEDLERRISELEEDAKERKSP
jgi:hypothetical protein